LLLKHTIRKRDWVSDSKYYTFNDMLEDSDVGFPHSELCKYPRAGGVTWFSGAPHRVVIPAPIEVELDPEYGTELLDAYHVIIPIWSDRLIEAVRRAAADNFELYDTVIRDPRTGLETTAYRAVNIIGRIDCSDMQQSEYDSRSEARAREFTRLVIDPKKTLGLKMFRLHERPTVLIINEEVKQSIEAAGVRGIRADAVALSKR